MADTSKEILRVLLDAVDLDLQLYAGNLLAELRRSPTGEGFAAWAENNPVQFHVMLRAISVVAQRYPADRGVLSEAIRDQLARLPAEIYRATLVSEGGSSTSTPQKGRDMDDFRRRYGDALEGLSEDDLACIARLSEARVREFVDAPPKLRPHLLERWRGERSAVQVLNEAAGVLAKKLKEDTDRRYKEGAYKPNRSSPSERRGLLERLFGKRGSTP